MEKFQNTYEPIDDEPQMASPPLPMTSPVEDDDNLSVDTAGAVDVSQILPTEGAAEVSAPVAEEIDVSSILGGSPMSGIGPVASGDEYANLLQMQPKQPTEQTTSQVPQRSGMAEGFVQGATLGAADEIAAEYLSMTTGVPRDKIQAMYQEKLNQIERDDPNGFLLGKIGGSISSMMGPGLAMKLPGLANIASKLGTKSQIALMSTLGAIEGGMSAKTSEDATAESVIGGVVGGTLGAAGIAVGGAVDRGVKKIASMKLRTSIKAIEEYMERYKDIDAVDVSTAVKIQEDLAGLFTQIEDDIAKGNIAKEQAYSSLEKASGNLRDLRKQTLESLRSIDIPEDSATKFAMSLDAVKEKIYALSAEAVDKGLKGKSVPTKDVLDAFDSLVEDIPGKYKLIFPDQQAAMSAVSDLKARVVDSLAAQLKQKFPEASNELIVAAVMGKSPPVTPSSIVDQFGNSLNIKSMPKMFSEIKKESTQISSEMIKQTLLRLQRVNNGAYQSTAGGHAADYSLPSVKEATKELYTRINKVLTSRFPDYDSAMIPVRDLARFKENIDFAFPSLSSAKVDRSLGFPVVQNDNLLDSVRSIARNLTQQRRNYIQRLAKESGVDLVGSIEAYNKASKAVDTLSSPTGSDILDMVAKAEQSKESLVAFYQLAPREIQSEIAGIVDAVSKRDLYDEAAGKLVELAKKYEGVIGRMPKEGESIGGLRFSGTTPQGRPSKQLSDLLERMTKFDHGPESERLFSKKAADAEILDSFAKFDSSGNLAGLRSALDDIAVKREFMKQRTGGSGQSNAYSGLFALFGGAAAGPGGAAAGANIGKIIAQVSNDRGAPFTRFVLRNYMRFKGSARLLRQASTLPAIAETTDSMSYKIMPNTPEHAELTRIIKNDKDLAPTKKVVALRSIQDGINVSEMFGEK